jgi:hypothetical protein
MKRETTFTISYNLKNALAKALIVGIVTPIIYLAVVIITTPNLPAMAAINAAFKMNSIIIFGLAAGIGTQIFLASYGKNLGCRIDKRGKGIFKGSGGTTAVSSFLSFFSLVPLGCCGTWLLLLSLLPSMLGSTFSVVLINYSKQLSYAGLLIVIGFTIISALRLRKELKERTRKMMTSHNSNRDIQYDGRHVQEKFRVRDQI